MTKFWIANLALNECFFNSSSIQKVNLRQHQASINWGQLGSGWRESQELGRKRKGLKYDMLMLIPFPKFWNRKEINKDSFSKFWNKNERHCQERESPLTHGDWGGALLNFVMFQRCRQGVTWWWMAASLKTGKQQLQAGWSGRCEQISEFISL